MPDKLKTSKYSILGDIDEQKREEVRFALQAKRSTALLELHQAAERLEETVFMQHGLEAAEELTGSQISFIHFINTANDSIELVAWSRRTLEQFCTAVYQKHYPIQQAGIWADAFHQKKPVIFNDYVTCSGKKGLPEGHSQLHRLISLPVLEHGKVVAIIGVGNKPKEYNELDLESVQLIANTVWRIVKHKRAEYALYESEKLLSSIAANFPNSYVSIIEKDLTIGFTSGLEYKKLKLDPEQFHGMHLHQVFGDLAPVVQERCVKTFDGEEQAFELMIDNQYFFYRTVPLYSQIGAIERVLCVAENITEQKRAEEALKSLATSFALLSGKEFFEGISRHIASALNVDFVFVGELNQGKEVVSVIGGWAKNEAMGEFTYELADTPCENVVGKQVCLYPFAVQSKFPKDRDLVHLAIEGYVGAPIFDKHGEPIGIIVAMDCKPLSDPKAIVNLFNIFVDRVSAEMQRGKAEEKLIESEMQFRVLFDKSPAGSLIIDLDQKLIKCNAAFCNFLGFSNDELIGKSTDDITYSEDIDLCLSDLNLLIDGKVESANLQKRFLHKNGTVVWGKVNFSLIRDRQQRPLYIIAVIMDITESKQAEQAIRESESKFRSIVESSPVGFHMYSIDENGKLIFSLSNAAASTILHFDHEQFIGCDILEVFPGLAGTNIPEMYAAVAKGELETQNFEAQYDYGGICGTYEVRVFQSIPGQAVVSFVDITKNKAMINELLIAKDKAEESDKMKTAFINNISHEIRTPLNSILGFGQLLTEMELSCEEREEYFKCIDQSSRRLLNTITDYMDIASIVSKTIVVNRNEFTLEPFFKSVIEDSGKLCANNQVNFIVDIPAETTGFTINSDIEILKKILNKLIDNAIKFTKKGNITCGYVVKSGGVEFYVRDTGCGIYKEKLELIFDLFTQENSSNTRGYEGSGLGLSIAKGLVALLGGQINATSLKGMGSEFTFTIPANYSEKVSVDYRGDQTAKAISNPKNVIVLVAEDDELNYMYLAAVLKSLNYQFIHVLNGQEAVDQCKQNSEISIVLMDIKMPVMSGTEATKLIREFRPNLPIIATTAYSYIDDKRCFLEAGCNDYITKPIRKKELLSLIKTYVE